MGINFKFDLTQFREIKLPLERDIIAGWDSDVEKPIVSVLCNTFNQEDYIADAIRGFLIQKTDFPFEIIIHDDASTDKTKKIIESYAKRYPSIIKPIFQEFNQYSKGVKPTLLSLPFAIGTYVAMCEGDDFWIDPKKLTYQVNAANTSKCDLVFTSALTLRSGNMVGRAGAARSNDSIIPVADIASGGGSYCPTASLLIRRTIINELISKSWFRSAPVGDLYIQVFSSFKNGAFYLNKDSCVYREYSKGSWSGAKNDIQTEQILLNKQLESISGMSEDLGIDFHGIRQHLDANAFYFSGIRMLLLREFSGFKINIQRAAALQENKSNGLRVLYMLRQFPNICLFLLSLKL